MLGEIIGEACMDFGKKYHVRGDLKCQRTIFATSKIRVRHGYRDHSSPSEVSPSTVEILKRILFENFPPKRDLLLLSSTQSPHVPSKTRFVAR